MRNDESGGFSVLSISGLSKRPTLVVLIPISLFCLAMIFLLAQTRQSVAFRTQVYFAERLENVKPESFPEQGEEHLTERYLIVAAGMFRSGSTWQFNVLRLLMSNLTDVVSGWYQDVSLKEEHKYALLKTHEYMKFMEDPVWNKVLTFTSHRDIRDVCASRYRAHNATPCTDLDTYVNSHKAISEVADYDMAYEEFVKDPSEVVISLAEALQNALPGFQWGGSLDTIDEILSRVQSDSESFSKGEGLSEEGCQNRAWGCMVDKGTGWHIRHITDGTWGSFKKTFAELENGTEVCRTVTDKYQEWLKKHGYPLKEAC